MTDKLLTCPHSRIDHNLECIDCDELVFMDEAFLSGKSVTTGWTYKRSDMVRKKGDKGQWRGKVVGFYSTEITPEGYAVESVFEKGSVQIYPVSQT